MSDNDAESMKTRATRLLPPAGRPRVDIIIERIILLLVVSLMIVSFTSCSGGKYMLDDPVNDPIMTADDQQDSDLVRVEEGGGGAGGGGCPT